MSPRTAEQNEQIKEQRKAEILQAAFEVFAEKGFALSTMAQIAKSANVSKGLLYNYFDSKEALLEHLFSTFVDQSDNYFVINPSLPARENLRVMLEAAFEFIETHTQFSRLISQLVLQKDIMGNLSAHAEHFIKEKVSVIAQLFEEMGIEDPEIEAMLLGSLLDGISFDVVVMGEGYPLERIKQKLFNRYQLI